MQDFRFLATWVGLLWFGPVLPKRRNDKVVHPSVLHDNPLVRLLERKACLVPFRGSGGGAAAAAAAAMPEGGPERLAIKNKRALAQIHEA